jgi:transcription elongation factor GreA-like protein/transcription elongation GreA/GreB family factor
VPTDYDFYFRIEKKIAAVLSGERAAALLNILLTTILDKQDWEICITILKKILEYEPKNPDARKTLIDCYKEKFIEHSQLNEYIRISNLNQSWRNVHDAIADFEKHIAFDKKNFVFHRTWGIGRIKDISQDIFVIDFAKKRGHKMSLKMAVNALSVLGNEHIWVLKGIMKREDLRTKIMTEPGWALKVIIKSFDNMANMKKIKTELVPDILNANEWTRWNTEARKILKTDPSFGNLPDQRDIFVVRDTPISFEEKTYNRFKAEKNFFGRIQIIQDYLKELEPDSEYFDDMFSYFTGFAKSYTIVSELVLASFILVKSIIIQYPYLNPGITYDFKDLYKEIDDLEGVFARLDDSELKKEFLLYIKRNVDEWPEIFIQLFKHYQNRFIIDELSASGRQDTIKDMFLYFMNHYKEFREPFIWLVRSFADEAWFKELNIPFEKILICMIYLLDITFREINNRRDVNLNRKLNKQIQTYLFKDRKLTNFITDADEDEITRLYTLIEDIKELDPTIKIKLRDKIKKKFPNFKFLGKNEMETKSRGILVTHRGYELKQKALRHILEVEVPLNSKDIGIAMEKGDLRENAEYKAALEKQDILNAQAARLQEELADAQIFDESSIDLARVSFYTKVNLFNLINHKDEEYIILGPWESEPTKNIISYLSPLGTKLYNHGVGEELKFTINEKHFHYRVNKIEKAPLDELVAHKS